jgi:DNA polymerase elongation subunit (family B)
MNVKTSNNFTVKSLGKHKLDVYDIEVADNHNFFGNNILVHNSNYIQLEEVINKLGLKFETDDEFRLWSYSFIDDVLQPLIDKALKKYADDYGVEQIINFKREKIISDMFVTGKKHYITRVLDSEGNVFEKPKLANTGLESKKVDTPDFIKDVLNEVLVMILANKTSDEIIEYVRIKRDEYETLPIYDIAVPGKISDFDKYSKPIDWYMKNGLRYEKGAPRRSKAAINHNYVIRKLNIKGRFDIDTGVNMRYVDLKKNNKFKIDVIAFSGEYPKEFMANFEVDYNGMWETTCMGLLENWFGVLRWGKPTMVSNTLMDFFR